MNEKTKDRWTWWRAACRGEFGDIHPDQPEQGYYRTRYKDRQWEPVAIWYADGYWHAIRNGKPVEDVEELWSFACRNPISYKIYVEAINGHGFPDEPPAPMGHNLSTDPHTALELELQGEREQAEEFLARPIADQAAADKIGIWTRRILDIGKRADQQHAIEKAPHLAAGRAVDEKWRGLTSEATALVERLRQHVKDFMLRAKRAEEKRVAEEARKARQLREAAQQAQEAAAQAQKAKIEDGVTHGHEIALENARQQQQADELMELARAAEAAAVAKPIHAGRTGAKLYIKTKQRARIVNYDQCLQALKDNTKIRELVQKLADKSAADGTALPGTELYDEEKVI